MWTLELLPVDILVNIIEFLGIDHVFKSAKSLTLTHSKFKWLINSTYICVDLGLVRLSPCISVVCRDITGMGNVKMYKKYEDMVNKILKRNHINNTCIIKTNV